MTCATCRESIGSSAGLLCMLTTRPAIKLCASYEREPGSDDVQMWPASVAVRAEPLLHREATPSDADGNSAVPADGAAVRRERGVQG